MRVHTQPRPGCILGLLWLACAPLVGAAVVLNECMPANLTTIHDEDEDTSDWIEIYNCGSDPQDMTGWGLSDDFSEPLKWTFPPVTIAGHEHMLIYASGKDRRDWAPHWETIIDWGDDWHYRANTSPTPEDWREHTFPDSLWPAGPSGFGFGDSDDSTGVPTCVSVSARRKFMVADPQLVRQLVLHVDYDDAFVAWLNGVEIARNNITSLGAPAWNQTADNDHEAHMYRGGFPETHMLTNAAAHLHLGWNVLAIEVHNIAPTNGDMSLIPFVTLGLESAPPGASGAADILRFCLPHLHTSFRLSACGEQLALSNPAGVPLDWITIGQMYNDMSYGREYDGSPDWCLFLEATPKDSNAGGGFAGFAEPPLLSHAGGFQSAPFALTMTAPPSGGQIYYTLDGSEPEESPLQLYAGPIGIGATTVVRARVYASDRLPSPIVTRTYFLGESITLPTVSLVTDPVNLWSEESGIYVLGPNAGSSFPYWGANFWQDWERPIHIEFFESDQSLSFHQDAGVKIHGGYSRAYPQKSLRLLARGGYGTAAIEYPIFAEKDLTSFSQLLLRNAGSDWCRAHLRDGVLHRLSIGTGLARQAYRPTVIFLNGEYWGIQHARERINGDYLAANFGCDPDQIDLLQNHNEVMAGDNHHYMAMLNYIEEHDLQDDWVFEHVTTMMDTDDYATYYIVEIFYANTDWPGGNIRYWRPRTSGGRWRWILTDLDWGLGFNTGYAHNTLAFALAAGGSSHPNPDWSTFLMRSLLENDAYRVRFINTYADHLNSTFQPARTLMTFNEIVSEVEPEMARHMTRWNHSIGNWCDEIEGIRTFLSQRPSCARHHIAQQFDLPVTLWNLGLDVEPAGAGRIALTAIEIDTTWMGSYFRTVPVSLTALPNAGYRFEGWSDPTLPSDPQVVIQPDSNYAVVAHFTEAGGPGDTLIVINEINYHSADHFDPGDWLELCNAGPASLDLGGWVFKDEEENHIFTLPTGTCLDSGGFLVLCQDTTAFATLFPEITVYIGEFDFGLSNSGEVLRLYDPMARLHDSVRYSDDPPWPPEPDGMGPTLELISPQLDNGCASSWAASEGHGTPGEVNSVHSNAGIDPIHAENLKWALPSLGLQRNIPPQTLAAGPIHFALDRTCSVELTLFGVTGRRVGFCRFPSLPAGVHAFRLSALTDLRNLSPGVYWLRMRADEFREVGRFCLVR